MSACMLTATIAVPDHEGFTLDYTAGRAALAAVVDMNEFGYTEDDTDFEFEFEGHTLEGEDIYDPADRIKIFRRAAEDIIAELEKLRLGTDPSNESHEINWALVGGYKVYIAGGMSHGDAPTDATTVLWDAGKLPDAVLAAIGFVVNPTRSARNSGFAPDADSMTDADAMDAIALGLGTAPEWEGADTLEWIANVVGHVREHPGDADPVEYHERFQAEYGFDPLETAMLRDYVDEEVEAECDDEDEEDE